MNVQALDFAKPLPNKKRVIINLMISRMTFQYFQNPLVIELHLIIDILRNFMFGSQEVKVGGI
jgi:hypothetical protein